MREQEGALRRCRDQPVLQRVLEGALASKVREVVCVVSDLASARRHITIENERLIWLLKYGADGGLNSSMIAGLWAIDPKSDGVLFLAGDQPFIRSELDRRADRALRKQPCADRRAVVSRTTEKPVAVSTQLFPDLLKLTGDRSGSCAAPKKIGTERNSSRGARDSIFRYRRSHRLRALERAGLIRRSALRSHRFRDMS